MGSYYDARVLTFIGNRIGAIVKVVKNMLNRERGKYARLCVQVDLTKPLLTMFTIKGRHYKVEYEGSRMFFLRCGWFGHLKEGCDNQTGMQKTDVMERAGENHDGRSQSWEKLLERMDCG